MRTPFPCVKHFLATDQLTCSVQRACQSLPFEFMNMCTCVPLRPSLSYLLFNFPLFLCPHLVSPGRSVTLWPLWARGVPETGFSLRPLTPDVLYPLNLFLSGMGHWIGSECRKQYVCGRLLGALEMTVIWYCGHKRRRNKPTSSENVAI